MTKKLKKKILKIKINITIAQQHIRSNCMTHNIHYFDQASSLIGTSCEDFLHKNMKNMNFTLRHFPDHLLFRGIDFNFKNQKVVKKLISLTVSIFSCLNNSG